MEPSLVNIANAQLIFAANPGTQGLANSPALPWLLTQAAAAIIDYIGWNILYSIAQEYYNGNDTSEIVLRRRNIDTTVAPQVYLDQCGNFGQTPGGFAANTLLTQGYDYAIDTTQSNTLGLTGLLTRLGNSGSATDAWPTIPCSMA